MDEMFVGGRVLICRKVLNGCVIMRGKGCCAFSGVFILRGG